MKTTLLLLLGLLTVAGCSTSQSAYEEMKNYRLTFLMSGTFQLENGYYEDRLDDDSSGYYVRINREFCLKTEFEGETYYATITCLNSGGTMFDYIVMVFKDGETVQTLDLGDRIRVKSLTASNGKIAVEYFTHRDTEKLSYEPTLWVEEELLLSEACADGTEYKRQNLKNPEILYVMRQPPKKLYEQEPDYWEPLPGDSVKYGVSGFFKEHDKEIETFIPKLQEALRNDDVDTIIDMLELPITLRPVMVSSYQIHDPEDFKRWYSRIFHPKHKEELLQLRSDEFNTKTWLNSLAVHGIRLHPAPNGRVVIKGICY